MIPIWHGVDSTRVAAVSPSLANIVALRSSLGVSGVVDHVASLLRPTDVLLKTDAGQGAIRDTGEADSSPLDNVAQFVASANDMLGAFAGKWGQLSLVVFVPSGDGKALQVRAAAGLPLPLDGLRVPIGSSLSGRSFQTLLSIVVEDYEDAFSDRSYTNLFATDVQRIRAMMALPIVGRRPHRPALGVIALQSTKKNAFRAPFFKAFGQMATSALAPMLAQVQRDAEDA